MKKTSKVESLILNKKERRKLKHQQYAQNKSEEKRRKRFADAVSCSLLLMGAFFFLLGILIYENTFIDAIIPLLIVFFVGLLFCPVFNKVILLLYNKKFSFFITYLYSLVLFGGILSYGFLSINYYLADPLSHKTKKFEIVSIGKLSGRAKTPYAEIKYQNKHKNIYFKSEIDLNEYKSLELEIEKGYFGFDIIEGKRLLITNNQLSHIP